MGKMRFDAPTPDKLLPHAVELAYLAPLTWGEKMATMRKASSMTRPIIPNLLRLYIFHVLADRFFRSRSFSRVGPERRTERRVERRFILRSEDGNFRPP